MSSVKMPSKSISLFEVMSRFIHWKIAVFTLRDGDHR